MREVRRGNFVCPIRRRCFIFLFVLKIIISSQIILTLYASVLSTSCILVSFKVVYEHFINSQILIFKIKTQ